MTGVRERSQQSSNLKDEGYILPTEISVHIPSEKLSLPTHR
ncbi:hypothetical protein ACK3F5_16585 [Photorhabdus asymbiotica UENP]